MRELTLIPIAKNECLNIRNVTKFVGTLTFRTCSKTQRTLRDHSLEIFNKMQ
ncbi:SLEI domain protein, PF07620 family [Leptospira noguchii str. 2006001870]|uniref:SLEI domain protein, PF07620 family n=1 Tax=Leptospira noguchii serovar Autumnalis str. ZUN142 TaxID=1085540 RepID=M6U194_9LEPT|nr:SLEI domain protein, PF07620 family [Leptospira noguchii str. 2006001870]EMO38802.1 SLEI domain protein, PF07620 family [Leptospira noguchii serovar Autumnalis str. ZUN142]